MRTVLALFDDRAAASRAVDALVAAGFDEGSLGVAMQPSPDPSPALAQGVDYASDATGEMVAAGAVGGGSLGGLVGLLAGAGMLTIPGIGPLLAAGPLATALAGGAMGAVTGSLAGTLIDPASAPEGTTPHLEGLRSGRILLAIQVDDGREREARSILEGVERHAPAAPSSRDD